MRLRKIHIRLPQDPLRPVGEVPHTQTDADSIRPWYALKKVVLVLLYVQEVVTHFI